MLEILRKGIMNSYIYRWLEKAVNIANLSVFFSLKYKQKNRKEGYEYQKTNYIKWLSGIGLLIDKLMIPFRKGIDESSIIKNSRRIILLLKEKTLIGKWILKFRPVYIVGLYGFIDYIFRYKINIGGLSSIWDELLLVSLLGYYLFKRIFTGYKYKFTSLDLPILFYMAIGLFLLIVNSEDYSVGIEGYRAVYQYIFWYFIVVQLIDSKETAKGLLGVTLSASTLLGMHAIYQYFTKAPMLGNWVDSGESITTRAYSILMSPNLLGSLLAFSIPMALGVLFGSKDVLIKLGGLVSTLIMGMGLIFTFSRGAWVTAFVGVLLFLGLTFGRLIISVILAVVGVLLNLDTIYRRVAYLFTKEYRMKSANGGRIYRKELAIDAWHENEWLGVGLGRHGGSVALNNNLSQVSTDNYMAKTLAEMGILGIIAFAFLQIMTYIQMIRSVFDVRSKEEQILLFGIIGGLMAMTGQNFFENIFESPFLTTYFWLHVALVITYSKVSSMREVS